jgi:uncharacterized MAPEG superfamily protein
MATNYHLLAIPAQWVLSLVPHVYALQLIKGATNGRWNNANPKGTSWATELQRSVPSDVLAKFERGEAAHRNGLENLPIFAAAILAAHVAGVDHDLISAHAAVFLGLRVVYTLIYVNVAKGTASFARTGVWLSSVLVCFSLFGKAALKGN